MKKDHDRILNELRPLVADLTRYSETAQADSYIGCYADSPDFLAIGADGAIRNYGEFRKICKDYYEGLNQQKLTTTHEIFRVLDELTVILCWSGNIDAFFRNGDSWKMKDYTVTFIFKKSNGAWKVIYSHESALPPEIKKSH